MAVTNVTAGPAGLSPSEDIIKNAARTVFVTDALGRQIEVRRVRTKQRLLVFKALSAESSAKPQYMGLVFLAASVVSIDGEPETMPTSELAYDALIQRLDDEGLEAVGLAIQENFIPSKPKDGEKPGE